MTLSDFTTVDYKIPIDQSVPNGSIEKKLKKSKQRIPLDKKFVRYSFILMCLPPLIVRYGHGIYTAIIYRHKRLWF